MEGEAVLISLTVAGVVALMILRFGRRRSPDRRRSLPDATPAGDAGAAGSDGVAESSPASTRRRRRPRIPRQRRESPLTRSDPAMPRSVEKTLVDSELLHTLEELAAHPQNRQAAINLLRQRTGMNARQARRFINAL